MTLNSILPFLLMFGLSSCAQPKRAPAKLYLVNFESSDIGDVRFYLELDLKDGKIEGGSLQNAYTSNFSFSDRTKINLFAGIKDKRLVSIKGYYQEKDNILRFRTAFFSPISNYYLNGTITNGRLIGELTTSDSVSKGKLSGALYEKGNPAPLLDYKKLSEAFCRSFEANFFDPAFLTSSKYRKFKSNLFDYSSKAQDDLHFVFSVFYYVRELPYSHIGLWRNEGAKDDDLSDKEQLQYTKKGTTGILTIQSFTTEEGALRKKFGQILNDNLSSLIIDLRGNPGGNIGPAIELGQYLVQKPTSGGYFLSRKYYESKIGSLNSCQVFSEGNLDQFMAALNQFDCIEVKIFPNQTTFKKPIYVLTDDGTASTCEPVVFALKQEANITTVGQKTAGKMLSAKEVPLVEGFVLFVPNADYITTSKERLDQKGVEPEINVKEKDALTHTLELIRN